MPVYDFILSFRPKYFIPAVETSFPTEFARCVTGYIDALTVRAHSKEKLLSVANVDIERIFSFQSDQNDWVQ